MSDTRVQDVTHTLDEYTPSKEHTDGSGESNFGMAYFMSAFCEFVSGTSIFQKGATDLTSSMESVIQNLTKAKDYMLKRDNDDISRQIDKIVYNKLSGEDLQRAQVELSRLQGIYKLDDTQYTSKIQSVSPSAQQDTDATTSISQNNAQVFQIAMYMIGTLQTLIQLLRAA